MSDGAEQINPTPEESAREAGLRYVSDEMPGITRRRAGKGFSYRNPDGNKVTMPADLKRIKALAIPPAWTDVWICPLPHGHIQATGRDDRGRKQYRYHPKWREVRDATKYDRMLAFAAALPAIREQVDEDLRRHGLPRERILATVVRLLETTLIRVGNEEYAKQNHSFGLTTMRARHVDVDGSEITFTFKGKSGMPHEVEVTDRRLARVISQCEELPGQELFQYLDHDGERHTISSEDVNDYLQEVTGEPFTAKDFRTWAGTLIAAEALAEFKEVDSDAEANKHVVEAIDKVARRLGNTRAICRACYIHPAVIDAYLDGALARSVHQQVADELKSSLSDLEPEEAAVLALLHARLAG
jgi:DNA topoisomerase-1